MLNIYLGVPRDMSFSLLTLHFTLENGRKQKQISYNYENNQVFVDSLQEYRIVEI